MNYDHFEYLIKNRSLYFAKADKLSDCFEGSLPRINYQEKQSVLNEEQEGLTKLIGNQWAKEVRQNADNAQKNLRLTFFVNCWAMYDVDQYLMWKSYLKEEEEEEEGVAIQSTYKQLRDSFESSNVGVFISMVEYIDFEQAQPDFNSNPCFCIIHKNNSFKSENELRAFTSTQFFDPKDYSRGNPSIDGIPIKVNLDILIERIVLSPNSTITHINSVKSLISNYSINKAVVKSCLDDPPLF